MPDRIVLSHKVQIVCHTITTLAICNMMVSLFRPRALEMNDTLQKINFVLLEDPTSAGMDKVTNLPVEMVDIV